MKINMAWLSKIIGLALGLLLATLATDVRADGHMVFTPTEALSLNYSIPSGDVVPARYLSAKDIDEVARIFRQGQDKASPDGSDTPASATAPLAIDTSQTLQGPHALRVNVVNARTGVPVPRYHLQTAITLSRPGENTILNLNHDLEIEKIARLPLRELYCIGQLESQEVNAPDGAARYERLGPMELELQAEAEGFLSNEIFIKVPDQGSSVTLRLTPAVTFKGRLVEAGSGQPLAGQEVGLIAPDGENQERFGFPIRPSHRATTDADGRFTLDGLPPARFQLYLPAAAHSREDLSDRLGGMLLKEGQDSGTAPDQQELEQRLSEVQAERLPLPDQKTIVDLTAGGMVDAGEIRIALTPLVELELASTTGGPLGNYPYEIEYLNGHYNSDSERLKGRTDVAGKARIPLVGWMPKTRVAIFVPGKMEDLYQVREVERANPNPEASTDVGDYYHYRLFLGEMGYYVFNNFWGVEAGKNYPEWDKMTSEQKDRFTTSFKERIAELRAQAAKLAARPEHPNYRLLNPEPGQVVPIKMIIRPAANEVTLNLRFVDKATSQPLGEVNGCVSERELSHQLGPIDFITKRDLAEDPDAFRTFQTAHADGLVQVPSLTLSAQFLEAEQKQKAGDPAYTGPRGPRLYVIAKSPDHVDQMFELTAEQARSNQMIALALEPEAVVRGRVVLADGSPLTSPTLKAALVRRGQWKPDKYLDGREIGPTMTPNMTMRNWTMEHKADTINPNHYPAFHRAQLDAAGRFELRGLRPDPAWIGEIETGYKLPAVAFRGIALKAGLNDLGDLCFTFGGTLTGRITDESGQGLAGVMIKYPCESANDSNRDYTRTGPDGSYCDALRLKGRRQIVRLIPPWQVKDPRGGDQSFSSLSDAERTTIMFDAVRELDLGTTNTLTTRLDRGHTLLVEVPSSPAREALLRLIDERKVEKINPDQGKDGPVHFSLIGAALQGLQPNPEGFVYLQQCHLTKDAPLGGGAVTVRIEHVPAGRHALRLDGAYVKSQPHSGQKARATGLEMVSYESEPVAWTEFEMRDTTTTIRLEPATATVVVDLADVPAKIAEAEPLPLVFFEREQPLSTLHSEWHRRFLTTQGPIDRTNPDNLILPMLGLRGYFGQCDAQHRLIGYRPAQFLAVPPGRYRLSAYPGVYAMNNLALDPYYATTVEVGVNAGEVRLTVPLPGDKY